MAQQETLFPIRMLEAKPAQVKIFAMLGLLDIAAIMLLEFGLAMMIIAQLIKYQEAACQLNYFPEY